MRGLLSLVVLLGATPFGCALVRTPIVGEDASGRDAPRADIGDLDVPLPPFDAPGCNPAMCNDMNPCTDDACAAAGGCTHTNNAASCDDGLFCTIDDRCQGGTCSANGGPPCPVCDEPSDSCGTCATAAECPGGGVPIDRPCTYADLCTTSGSRMVTTYACVRSTCMATVAAATCTRDTAGMTCGSTTVEPGACVPTGTDCGTAGIHSVVSTAYVCSAGMCEGVPAVSAEPCTADPVGQACRGCGAPGLCLSGPLECSGSTTRTCGAGTCSAVGTCAVSGGTSTITPCSAAASTPCRGLTCGPCMQMDSECRETCSGIADGVCDGLGTCYGTSGTFTRPCFGCTGGGG